MAPTAPPDPLVGKVLADRFEILSRIGEGGTGVVYKARQIAVDRMVAIKVLGAHVSQDPSWVKRFHNEARAAARLDHPNTVRLIDFGETKEGLLFIAMEFLQGRSLAEEIARIGRLPPQRMLRILQQMCRSLHEAHTHGIIHRDIKPDNVFLVDVKGSGDFVKVLDFSVAKIDAPDAQATRAGLVFGTPAYMSPEQARGVKLTPQSDIYSCGIVAYEMLTGKPPFEAKLPMEVVMMHLRQKPAPLTGFPEQVAALVMKALEKQPQHRQQSAEEMAEECQRCLDLYYPRQTPATGMQALVSERGTQEQAASTGPAAPPSPLPPPGGVPVGAPAAEQRTVVAQQAPVPHARGRGQAAGRTQALDTGGINATAFMSEGLSISPMALAVRQQALAQLAASTPPLSRLYWVGWALIGMSLGLALHFFWPTGGA
ncbi:MAG: serine/threonine-protein kinase [Myxococcales bacterium]|nr:serine/threonine protein kinase [Myxococcota bacterium]MDW8283253.1 serine/threonine-protein kinase [Myxococcales bacterium]